MEYLIVIPKAVKNLDKKERFFCFASEWHCEEECLDPLNSLGLINITLIEREELEKWTLK